VPEEIQEGDLAIGEMEVFTQINGGFGADLPSGYD
jgi:hypothetical protein